LLCNRTKEFLNNTFAILGDKRENNINEKLPAEYKIRILKSYRQVGEAMRKFDDLITYDRNKLNFFWGGY